VAVIDDNAEVLEAVRTVLEVAGHAVVAATSLPELVDQLRQRGVRPNVLLTDYRLSAETTGLDVIATLRREFAPGLPAVVLTGDSSFSLLERKQSELGFDLLAKPVVTRDLLQTLARRLRDAGDERAGNES
jgi:CheY-like chemotaxis protein